MATVHPRLMMWHLMNETRVAMVSFRKTDGRNLSQPMTLFNKEIPRSVLVEEHLEQQHQLYFFVRAEGELCRSVEAGNTELGVTFSKHSADLYAYVEGRASISNDRKQIEQLWTPTAEAWFNGYQDPQLRLLLVHGESADVWHNTHTATQQWWHITKKAVGAGDETPLHTKDHLQL